MRFHGNQVSWGINHSFINLSSKYQPSNFICSSIVLAPVISSLDEIHCVNRPVVRHFDDFLTKMADVDQVEVGYLSSHRDFRRSLQIRLHFFRQNIGEIHLYRVRPESHFLDNLNHRGKGRVMACSSAS